MIYEALGSLRVFRNSVIGPPLPKIPVAVVVPAAVVESVSQLVAEYRADGAVIQSPAIEADLRDTPVGGKSDRSEISARLFLISIQIEDMYFHVLLLETQFIERELENSGRYSCTYGMSGRRKDALKMR